MKTDNGTNELICAAFRAGWAAAMIALAHQAEKNGEREVAADLRSMAQHPPPVEALKLNPGEALGYFMSQGKEGAA